MTKEKVNEATLMIVCRDCGERGMDQPREVRGITLSTDECDVCGFVGSTSPTYNYGWTAEAYRRANAKRERRIQKADG